MSVLSILEVSKKQAYIFSNPSLISNINRSHEIAYVTSSDFFSAVVPWYKPASHLVYGGGGHTVLQFPDEETAIVFARLVTKQALIQYPNMELVVKTIDYDAQKLPKDNLLELSKALERKKARREYGFHQVRFGLEALPTAEKETLHATPLEAPAGYEFPTEFNKIAGKDNFIAVVHIDGNAMGTRVEAIYKKSGNDWDKCRTSLQSFSKSIDDDFHQAWHETAKRVADHWEETGSLPMRPIILAGDDVCFVTQGNLGLECARIFLEQLSQKKNAQDGQYYAACAGVAMVHTSYPFSQAYNLAEALCSNAKKMGTAVRPDGTISAIDWHIEFGQMKRSLQEIRKDYETGDGLRMELRPLTVVVPQGCTIDPVRTYDFFSNLFSILLDDVPRGKLKELRPAIKAGEVEARHYLRNQSILPILKKSFLARVGKDSIRETIQTMSQGNTLEEDLFRLVDGEKHCLLFDAIELMDHYLPIQEVEL